MPTRCFGNYVISNAFWKHHSSIRSMRSEIRMNTHTNFSSFNKNVFGFVKCHEFYYFSLKIPWISFWIHLRASNFFLPWIGFLGFIVGRPTLRKIVFPWIEFLRMNNSSAQMSKYTNPCKYLSLWTLLLLTPIILSRLLRIEYGNFEVGV